MRTPAPRRIAEAADETEAAVERDGSGSGLGRRDVASLDAGAALSLGAESPPRRSDALLASRRAAIFPRVEERHYSDVEEQAGSVPGHEQVYSQLTPGAFRGSLLTHFVSERCSFSIERTNRSIRKRFAVSPRHLRLGMMLYEQHHCCGNGRILFGDDVSVNLPMTSLDLHFTEMYQEYVGCWVTLDLEAAAQVGIDERIRLDQPGRSQVSGAPAQLLRTAIATARKELFAPGSPPVSAGVAAAFEKTLLSMAAWTVCAASEAGKPPGRMSMTHRARLFRRACEMIDARLADRLTMQELCSMLGVSRRTLENVFLETVGSSPYQYVRMLRLNVIRRELLAEENHAVPIGDIAAKYGIWHLSRFAQDYRRLFGHLPSHGRRLTSAG